MGLHTELVRQGNWLFRRRSFLPLVFLAPLAVGVWTMRWPFGSYAFHILWEHVCLGVSLSGVLVRVLTVGYTPEGTSGRNTEGQIAETLNTKGIYATVRHPLYLGNYLIGLGAVMLPFEAWLVAIYTLAFWLYYERIMMAEEAFLHEKFGRSYKKWARRTSPFVPRPWRWTQPDLPFSLRNVLKREYTALALTILLHAMIEVCEHLAIDHRFKFEPVWFGMLMATVALYFVLRGLKRHTRWLHVEGR